MCNNGICWSFTCHSFFSFLPFPSLSSKYLYDRQKSYFLFSKRHPSMERAQIDKHQLWKWLQRVLTAIFCEVNMQKSNRSERKKEIKQKKYSAIFCTLYFPAIFFNVFFDFELNFPDSSNFAASGWSSSCNILVPFSQWFPSLWRVLKKCNNFWE